MAKPGKDYAARINVCSNGVAYLTFGERAPKLMKDEGGYYTIEPSDEDKSILFVTRYSYKRNRRDGKSGILNGQVKFGMAELVDSLKEYIGEYSAIDMTSMSDNGSTTHYILSTTNRSNFTNMYAKRSGKAQEVADIPKKEVEVVQKEEKESDANTTVNAINDIINDELKKVEDKIKKLQAELDPLIEARYRLTKARECLTYHCEFQKGEV